MVEKSRRQNFFRDIFLSILESDVLDSFADVLWFQWNFYGSWRLKMMTNFNRDFRPFSLIFYLYTYGMSWISDDIQVDRIWRFSLLISFGLLHFLTHPHNFICDILLLLVCQSSQKSTQVERICLHIYILENHSISI